MAYQLITGEGDLTGAKVGIVASRYNPHIVDRLFAACLEALKDAGIQEESILVVHVPGAFEIPVAVQRLILRHECEAVIALGAIIRGETSHFEYIARECSHGLAQLAVNQDVPVIFGVLTADNSEQALDRSGAQESNKGTEAAVTAIHMIRVMRRLK